MAVNFKLSPLPHYYTAFNPYLLCAKTIAPGFDRYITDEISLHPCHVLLIPQAYFSNLGVQAWLGMTLANHIGMELEQVGSVKKRFTGTGTDIYRMTEMEWVEYLSGRPYELADRVAKKQGAQMYNIMNWIYRNKRREAGLYSLRIEHQLDGGEKRYSSIVDCIRHKMKRCLRKEQGWIRL